MAREEGFFGELARGLADDSVTRGKALRLMGAALLEQVARSLNHTPSWVHESVFGRSA
jgi:hypothetical protein